MNIRHLISFMCGMVSLVGLTTQAQAAPSYISAPASASNDCDEQSKDVCALAPKATADSAAAKQTAPITPSPLRTPCQELMDTMECQGNNCTVPAEARRLCREQEGALLQCWLKHGSAVQHWMHQAPLHTSAVARIQGALDECKRLDEAPAPTPARPEPPQAPWFCPQNFDRHYRLLPVRVAEGMTIEQALAECHGRLDGAMVRCDSLYITVLVSTNRVLRDGREQTLTNDGHTAVICIAATPGSPAGQVAISVTADEMCNQMTGHPCAEARVIWDGIEHCIDVSDRDHPMVKSDCLPALVRGPEGPKGPQGPVGPAGHDGASGGGASIRVMAGVELGFAEYLWGNQGGGVGGVGRIGPRLTLGLRVALNVERTWEFQPTLALGIGFPSDKVGPVLDGQLRAAFLHKFASWGDDKLSGFWLGPYLAGSLTGKAWDEPRWIGDRHSWAALVGLQLQLDLGPHFFLQAGVGIGGGTVGTISGDRPTIREMTGFVIDGHVGLGWTF